MACRSSVTTPPPPITNQYRHFLEDEDFTSRYCIIAYDMARNGKSDPPRNAE